MCNTAYNLKTVFSSLAFLKFGHPFAITTCTLSNMSLKSEMGGRGLQPPQPPLTYTLVHIIDTYYTKVKYLHCHALRQRSRVKSKIEICMIRTDGRGVEDKLHKQVCLEASVYSK